MIITAKKITTILASNAGLITNDGMESCDIILQHGGDDYFEMEIVHVSGPKIRIGFSGKKLLKMAKRIKRGTDCIFEYEYGDYEALKADWIESNPSCTKEQYEEAMHDIAEKCGV